MIWTDILKLVFEGIAAFSVILGAVYYVFDKLKDRRDRTINTINSLIDEYHEKISGKNVSENYTTHRAYLGKVERFCIGVNSKVFSVGVLKKIGSKFIVKLFNDYKDNVIPKSRKDFNDEDKYKALEKLALKLNKK